MARPARPPLLTDSRHTALELIASGAPRSQTVDALCTRVEAELGDARCYAMLLRSDGTLAPEHAPSLSARTRAAMTGMRPGPDSGSCGAATFAGEPVFCSDVAADPRWTLLQTFAREEGVRACWAAPVVLDDGSVAGTFSVFLDRCRVATDEERDLMFDAARLVGLALDRERERGELEQNRQLLESVVEGTRDGVFAKDRDGVYVLMNGADAAVLGHDGADAVGRTDAELLPPDLAHKARESDLRVQSKGCVESYELEVPRPDGPPRVVHVVKAPRRDTDGNVVGVLGVARDVTGERERHARELQLERCVLRSKKLESLGAIAGGVAHDFNNLLLTILGHAELAAAAADVDGAREQLQPVIDAVHRAARLNRQLLACAGEGALSTHPVNLDEVVATLEHVLRETAPPGASLEVVRTTDLPPVEADPEELRQVLSSLVANAAEAVAAAAGEEPGRIAVTTGTRELGRRDLDECFGDPRVEPGLFVYVAVEDDGEGMDEATRERMFDPFFTTRFQGRGLGLAAALGTLRAHGGVIEVDSAPGVGTRVAILLPAAEERMSEEIAGCAEATEQPEPAPDERTAWRETVLVVDDDPNVLALARTILESAGLSVRTAANGRAGIEELRRHRADTAVALVDLTMPGIDGIETARAMNSVAPEVPVLLTSGHHDPRTAVRLGSCELAGFLQKPYSPEVLVQALRGAIDGSRPTGG